MELARYLFPLGLTVRWVSPISRDHVKSDLRYVQNIDVSEIAIPLWRMDVGGGWGGFVGSFKWGSYLL